MGDLSNAERLSMFRRHQEEQRILKEKSIRDSIDARRTFERLLGPQLERVLINAQMSGFGGEAEVLCSTKALPGSDPTATPTRIPHGREIG